MQYIDDNNMDDLFRQAADQYPLKITGADWDSIAKELQQPAATDTAAIASKTKTTKRSRLLWLLLLLPFTWICVHENGTINKQTASVNNSKTNQAGVPEKQEKNILPSAKQNGQSLLQVNAVNTVSAEPDLQTNASLQRNEDKHAVVNSRANSISLPVGDGLSKQPVTALQLQTVKAGTVDLAAIQLPGVTLIDQNEKSKKEGILAGSGIRPDETSVTKTAEDKDADKKQTDAVLTDSSAINQATHAAKKTDKKKGGLYVGLVTGPDISTVKMQSVKGIGYTLGFLAGYRFKKNIAVEAGIFWDKKKYFSDGKYFDKTKTSIPSYVMLNWLDGDCTMWEIPVTVRYSFRQKKNSGFFAAAGLTSYIMKKENYDYLATHNNMSYEGYKSYNNSGTNFLSVMSLCLGYEHNIGSSTKLRVEPYLKIPLKGLGIGSMPITSSGLYIGITHSFH